jgi:hypothetical protein
MEEIVNNIKGLVENVDETIIVQKVLRSLPLRFDPNISYIEDIKGLDNLIMDELHGIPTVYEMRIEKDKEENSSKKEVALKESKMTKTKQNNSSDSSDSESNEEEVNFIRKLKRGWGKYKGNIPFKCFNCGEVGHFVAKCPYTKDRNNNKEEDSILKNYKMGNAKKQKFNKQRKNLYANEDGISSNESHDDEIKSSLYGLRITE